MLIEHIVISFNMITVVLVIPRKFVNDMITSFNIFILVLVILRKIVIDMNTCVSEVITVKKCTVNL